MASHRRQLRDNGPLLLLLGYALFGSVPLTVKYLSQLGVAASQIVFFRFLLCSFFVVLILVLRIQPLRAYNKKALFFRGIAGGLSVFLWFLALEYTTAAKGTLLSYTHSIWANIFNALFLGQRPHRGFWGMLALASSGVWLVLDPAFEALNRGDVLALCAGACAGVAVLSIKEARRTDNALSVFASFSWIGLATAAIFLFLPIGTITPMPWSEIMTSSSLLLTLLLMGVVSTLGQLLFTQGYGHASVALGTVLSLLVPIITASGEWALFGKTVSWRFVVGAALVLCSCAASGVLESRSLRVSEDPL